MFIALDEFLVAGRSLMCADDNLKRPAALPDDVASCHAMLEEAFQALAERDKRIGELEEIMDHLIRQRQRRRAKRIDPDQLKLF